MVLRPDVGGGSGQRRRRQAHPRADASRKASDPAVRGPGRGRGLISLCGRFEGFDERIFEARAIEPVSIGDYVLSGGEVGAMVILDACVRPLPGVMGAASSGEEESFEAGLLEYPHLHLSCRVGSTIPKCCGRGIMRRSPRGDTQGRSKTRLWRPDLIERHGAHRRHRPRRAA